MDKNIISFENVSIGYVKKIIHRNINLNISKNDFIGLVGPNGAGKTTFLKTLLGNINPIVGSIKKTDIKFGYVPQRDTVQPLLPFTVNDVVMMGRYSMMNFFQKPSKKDEEYVDESLRIVGISELKNHNYNSLSGGQRQRTLIARALAVNPDILILDEPTNGMDTPSHYSLLKLISELHDKKGLTIIFVSHLLSDVANLVKKIILMDIGKCEYGSIDDVLSEENLAKIYSANIGVKKINGEYHITSKMSG